MAVPFLAQPPAELTRQRGVIAVSRIATAKPSIVSKSVQRAYLIWAWAPTVFTFLLALVGLLLLRNPDIVLVVPAKLLSWGWTYLWFAGSRFLVRLELEITSWFTGHPNAPHMLAAPGENPIVPAGYMQPAGPPQGMSLLGWLIAAAVYARH